MTKLGVIADLRADMNIIFANIFLALMAACAGEDTASTRGQYVGSDVEVEQPIPPEEEKATATPQPDIEDDSIKPVVKDQLSLTVDDIYLYFADDRKGAIDRALVDISSDELSVAVNENLGDQGLVERLVPLYLELSDTDKSGDLNFAEFLDAGVEKDGQESTVRSLIQTDKKTLFDFIDFGRDNLLDRADLLRLVRVRVWRLRHWSSEVDKTAPTRLRLLVENGYRDLHGLVAKTYNAGALTADNFNKLVAAIKKKAK